MISSLHLTDQSTNHFRGVNILVWNRKTYRKNARLQNDDERTKQAGFRVPKPTVFYDDISPGLLQCFGSKLAPGHPRLSRDHTLCAQSFDEIRK